jgi:hypothetical protein
MTENAEHGTDNDAGVIAQQGGPDVDAAKRRADRVKRLTPMPSLATDKPDDKESRT